MFKNVTRAYNENPTYTVKLTHCTKLRYETEVNC